MREGPVESEIIVLDIYLIYGLHISLLSKRCNSYEVIL